jgi:acetyltransferase-like isoleucine patch superfamily enzyme
VPRLTRCSIVRPDRDRTEDGVLAVTHDQTFANPALQAKTPFVKPPIFIDYGVRLQVGGSTFINRNCMIMDTPVADVVIGEGCNIGPNCCIIGVTRESFFSSYVSAACRPSSVFLGCGSRVRASRQPNSPPAG